MYPIRKGMGRIFTPLKEPNGCEGCVLHTLSTLERITLMKTAPTNGPSPCLENCML